MSNETIPHEAALTTTLKGEGRDAPWIVIRSRDASQLQSQLRDLEHGSVFTDVGRVTTLMNTYMRMGAKLDAKPLDPQAVDGNWENPTGPAANASPAHPAPQQQSAPPATLPSTGSAGPGPSQQPVQQAPQQFPGASGGPMAAPMGANAAPPQQGAPGMAPPQQMWGNAVVPPAPQQGQAPPQWMPPGAPAAPIAPAAPQGMFSGPPPVPGAPMILGRPARHQSGSGARGPWNAFFDPRSPEELASIPLGPDGKRPQTDNPNDPGLAAGTHEFCLFFK